MGEVLHTEKMVSVAGMGEGLITSTFSLSPKAIQFNLFVYDFLFLQAIVPPLDTSVNAWKILCAGSLRGWLGFQQFPVSPRQIKSLLIYPAKYYVGFSSGLLCSRLGGVVEVQTLPLLGRTFAVAISLRILNLYTWYGASLFPVSTLPQSQCGFFCQSLVIRLLFRLLIFNSRLVVL